jgi:nucleoside-triphosphatase THEP1
MAKALFGHVGGADLRLVDEVRHLRTRVRELEAELSRVRAANDALVASVHVEDDIRLLTLDDEHALT